MNAILSEAKRVWFVVLQSDHFDLLKEDFDYEPGVSDIEYAERHWSRRMGMKYTAINVYSVLA